MDDIDSFPCTGGSDEEEVFLKLHSQVEEVIISDKINSGND